MPSSHAYQKASAFDNDLPAIPESPTEDDLKPWRDRIDQIDRSILRLLNEREVHSIMPGMKLDSLILVLARLTRWQASGEETDPSVSITECVAIASKWYWTH